MGLYRDNGKEHGNYYLGLYIRVYSGLRGSGFKVVDFPEEILSAVCEEHGLAFIRKVVELRIEYIKYRFARNQENPTYKKHQLPESVEVN